MTTTTANPYMLARKEAKMTQIEASPKLHIDARTLQKYEKDRTPPREIRAAMAREYKAPQLCVDCNSPAAAMGAFLKEFEDVNDLRREIMAITCDDRIDENEKPRCETIRRELGEAITAFGVLINALV